MMATFVLAAMLVNAVFQRALSNHIVAKHPELWLGVRFRIMDDPICNELRVISIATGEDATRITLSGTCRLITEKNMPPFLWSPQLVFSALQYSVFPARCNKRDAPDWMLRVKTSLFKTTVDCFLGYFSS
ncbi:hypothetical protein TNCV_4160231 [Trichonephila clavipes]|nr:hypothetical protein TNCV_4160231 [Trichonephila clavipes]